MKNLLLVGAVVLLVIIVGSLACSHTIPILPSPTSTPIPTPVQSTPTPTSTSMPTPMATSVVTSLLPTATPNPIPTATPSISTTPISTVPPMGSGGGGGGGGGGLPTNTFVTTPTPIPTLTPSPIPTPIPTKTEWALSVSAGAGGLVQSPGVGTFMYEDGSLVSLVALSSSGYAFESWDGDIGTVANKNSASTTITMNGSHSIRANFFHTSGALASPRRFLPDTVQVGSTFDVIVTFEAPYGEFNSILVQDMLPVGWDVGGNIEGCDPEPENVNTGDGIEYIWYGPFESGRQFTAVYSGAVPLDAELGYYAFSGMLTYYIAGSGPYSETISGDLQITVVN